MSASHRSTLPGNPVPGMSHLDVCEREPLHRSGAILSHGALLVVDPDGHVVHASANVGDFLGAPAEAWLGARLPAALHQPCASLDMAPGSRSLLQGATLAGAEPLDLVLNRSADGCIALEFLPHRPDINRITPCPGAGTPADEAGLALVQDALVRQIAQLTGFQRVMLYRFREDDDGEVIAESRPGDAYGSYLGLRFPASDIPRIARALYMNNPWRMIPDAAAEAVPVLGVDASPPDLTHSDLRSVSGMHRIYLANMGVRASLSFPVVIADKLVALVACHHASPRQLPLPLIDHAAQTVRCFGMTLSAYQARQRMRLVDGMGHRFAPAAGMLERHGDLLSAWPELAPWLMAQVRADGALVLRGDTRACVGTCLEATALEVLERWFLNPSGELLWSGDNLSRQVPDYPLSEIAGVLALRVGRDTRIYLCRSEYIHEVAWGGNPDKPVEYHDGALGIAPRHSFEKWVEKRLGFSRPWDNEARLLALRLRELLAKEARA